MKTLSPLLLLLGWLCLVPASPAQDDGWEATVNNLVPGPMPEPRPVRVRYNFGWGGFSAATADIRAEKLRNGQFRFDASGGTIGLARTLWAYKIHHTALSDAATLRPVQVSEVENIRTKRVTTELTFSPQGVSSAREEQKGDAAVSSRARRFEFPNVLSLDAALLVLRSQPLTDGSVQRVVVYPATSAYFCTITVLGRERISLPTGTYDAIKVDLQLRKIGQDRKLVPYKKFSKATAWLSNDADRILLRVEAQIFIGKVYMELDSVEFGNGSPNK